MSRTSAPAVKNAHVNLSTDTIIANLPADGLRSIIRTILVQAPEVTDLLEEQAKKYLRKTMPSTVGSLFINEAPSSAGARESDNFYATQKRIRSMLGCGLGFESLALLRIVVEQVADLHIDPSTREGARLMDVLAAVDGDMVQAITAVQKTLLKRDGSRALTNQEIETIEQFSVALLRCLKASRAQGYEFVFDRGLTAISEFVTIEDTSIGTGSDHLYIPTSSKDEESMPSTIPLPLETFDLGPFTAPRLFGGLWQLSSPAWGVASQVKIMQQFAKYVDTGYTAFDMADHYGDAELIFGRFRASHPSSSSIIGSTKYCVFHPITVTPKVVQDNVTERLTRLGSETVDLLQFHWQDYSDPQYIKALQLLEKDSRVTVLGLCNFDSKHLQHVIDSGIHVATNQVQFSLIDSRPTFKMGDICEKHNIKLLTYGTLCGGFLADKWLGQEEPELFVQNITPSQRKYFEMINTWGGWTLFQELLAVLSRIAEKHSVGISNVATRWVLDFPYVGAVIVGARMGVSEHADENLASYGWQLDEEDNAAIDQVQAKSRRAQLFDEMGDCGSEYR
ncbi:hypothetical protein A1O3_08408 [Capronia epimyces CBS 606.96]|uniref:NADP-dependent oxidoreductase domain-containing protein n=1 Tax=Capronia epimyces CBS 606.96 TaxID=1182542 RepID=W9XFD4_9EURO|nr:uncharacterized protein A1O3_08408 [Capronia epimyces CBS 606.96]EXJ78908.1 hypothetical protein A1O3_08408 [Capronia epimyces CBS 606.96]